MNEIAASDVGKTFDCKTPNCPNTARSNVGRYSYCGDCQARKASESVTPPGGGFEARVQQLQRAGKHADRLARRAKRLTAQALTAKAAADAAGETFRELARTLGD